jgi:hypothetical protein
MQQTREKNVLVTFMDQQEADTYCCDTAQSCKLCHCPKLRLHEPVEHPLNTPMQSRQRLRELQTDITFLDPCGAMKRSTPSSMPHVLFEGFSHIQIDTDRYRQIHTDTCTVLLCEFPIHANINTHKQIHAICTNTDCYIRAYSLLYSCIFFVIFLHICSYCSYVCIFFAARSLSRTI